MRGIATAIALLALGACSENVSPRAERVFYRDDGGASWGTVCKLNRRGFLGLGERGYISVAHVTGNGTPVVGPTDAVTRSDALSDWSFLGIDPAKLDAADYPALTPGQAVEIHGFPARDRDGEVIPGAVYIDDPVPPFWWVELRDSDDGIAAEGVIGGISGSCVFDDNGALVAVVHANGFSQIERTTNTWAKVVPVREAILQAQRRVDPAATVIASAGVAPLAMTAPALIENTIEKPVVAAPTVVASPAPPMYIEVAPTFVDPVQPAPAPAMEAASATTVMPPVIYSDMVVTPPTAPVQAAPPIYRQIIPAPRAGYRVIATEPAGGFRCTVCF